jgi:imidazolonepropionase-like amidohydrolase
MRHERFVMRDALIRTMAPFAAYGFLLWGGAPSAQDLRIDHVTIVSSERESPLRDADVYIRNGRISAISESGTSSPPNLVPKVVTISGRNLYLIPGLIDSHVHLGAIQGMTAEQEQAHPDIARAAREQIPRSYLYSGFTTLVDLISTPEAMASWRSHDPVPDTYFCGGAALMDGYPMNYAPKPARYTTMPYMIVEPQAVAALPQGVEAAEHTPATVVARMKSDGAVCVKTFFERGFGGEHDLPVPQPETIRALVRAAHAQGLPVLMHANSAEAQTFALDMGVDIIAHGLWNVKESSASGDLTPEMKSILDRVIATKVGWQPTIQVLHGLQDLFTVGFLSDPMLARVLPHSLIDWYGTHEGQWFHDVVAGDVAKIDASAMRPNFSAPIARDAAATRYLAEHGGRLLFGTDTPSAPTYANPPGLNGWFEIERLAAAGMTPAQIFRAATLSNAQAFHLDGEIGTVQVGKRANLLLLRRDPTQTIQAYVAVAKVILAGRVLDPADLVANRKNARPGHVDAPPMSGL